MSTTESSPTGNHRGGCVLAIVLVIGIILGAVLGVLAILWPGSPLHRIGGENAHPATTADSSKPKQLWTCGMHPQIIQDHPGLCPICHMDLTPMKSGNDAASGDPTLAGFTIDPAVVQNMGVRTAKVTIQPLRRSIRAFGYLEEAQPNIHDVNLRVSGWIRKLHANTVGMHIKQGDPLFDLYSPELQLAIEELIAAKRGFSAMPAESDEMIKRSSQSLVEATSRKLEVLGLPREQIMELAKLERAPETLTFLSSSTGIVTEKSVVDGSEVKAGDTAMRIVDYSTLWLETKIFEKDLPFVKLDQRVAVALPTQSDVDPVARVIFISPTIDAMTRTATARVQLTNDKLALKPGMYATARIEVPIADDALVVPREAVIDTGEKQLAFIMPKPGHFEPRDVRLGAFGDDGLVQVLDGLSDGETVVVSGQFLLDSESHIREAARKFLSANTDSTAAGSNDEVTHSKEPEKVIPLHGEWQTKLDAAVIEYLALAKTLGASQTAQTTIDPSAFIAASQEIREAWTGMPTESIARQLDIAAEALKGKPLDQQREHFKVVSAALIELAGTHHPSRAVAAKLFVIHCPMAPGDWLSTTDDVANPYYATDMKECGAVVWTIEPPADDEAATQKDGHR